MHYKITDSFEAAIGTFSAILTFTVLRDPPGPFINPIMGFIISLVWFYILYESFAYKNGKKRSHFFADLTISMLVSISMILVFNLATIEQLTGFQIFGSPVMIAVWLGLPIALVMDKANTRSILSKYYVNKKR